MLYRIATLNDVPELVQLRRKFLKELSPDLVYNDETWDKELHDYFQSHLAKGDFINWVAVDDIGIVGTGGMCIHHYPPTFDVPSSNRAYLLNIFTLPSHRKRGIASALLSRLINEAKARKTGMITLHASAIGRGIYEGFGFKERESEMALILQS